MATAVLCGAICLLVGASGCGFQPTGDQLQVILGQVFGEDTLPDPNATVIRIINESGADLQLTLDIDGQLVLFEVPDTTPISDFRLPQCPQTVRAIAERRFDSGTGEFVGGRDFIGTDPQYNLERPDDFECGSVIIYRFFGGQVEVIVL